MSLKVCQFYIRKLIWNLDTITKIKRLEIFVSLFPKVGRQIL